MTFIGVPIDSVGRSGGTEHGPAALRDLGMPQVLGGRDAGDLSVRIRGDERDATTGIVGSPDVLRCTTVIRDVVSNAVRDGERPFLAGGCCTELPGALAGARDVLGRVGLAYLDGHIDLHDGVTSPTGEAADMPVATALGFGPVDWVAAAGGHSVAGADVAIVGYRDASELPLLEQLRVDGSVEGVELVDRTGVTAEGAAVLGARIVDRLEAVTGGFWLHLDVDVLDESVFPATDYLMPGGLSWDELVELMRPLVISPALIGASIGCYNPDKDPDRVDGRALVAAWRTASMG